MRDLGLSEAIRAAGGVSELARRLGISQPSISNWSRIPAERVLAVEAATQIHRGVLRPDLFSNTGERRSSPSMRIIGLAGWSGSGKTSLLAKLIPCLTAQGLRVSTLKHAHAGFDVDVPGKDSHTHRISGATEVLVSSPRRFALMHELRGAPELELPELLRKLSPVDLVLVEGYKRHAHPKLEVFRAEVGKEFIHPNDTDIFAIASDLPLPEAKLPVIDLNDIDAIVAAVLKHAAPVADMLAARTG